jgi:uncharacterized protein YndB with AHSA1/START domain
MAQFKTSIVIQRPLEMVFAMVSNYQNSSLWVSGALEHQQITPGPIGVGTVIRTRGRFMGQPIEATRTVSAYEPPMRYAFRSAYQQVPFTTLFVFEAVPNGTQLTATVEGEPTGLYKAAMPLILSLMRQQLEGDLRRLKKLLEEQSTTCAR